MFRLAGFCNRFIFYANKSDIYGATTLIYTNFLLYAKEAVQWSSWWVTFTILMIVCACGHIIYPIYMKVFMYMDTDFKVRKHHQLHKIKMSKNHPSAKCIILPLAARLCVLTKAFNVHSNHLAYLRQPIPDRQNSYANNIIRKWKILRQHVGYFPPHGWPLTLSYFMFGLLLTIMSIVVGYKRILKAKRKFKPKPPAEVYSTSNNISEMQSEVFDADSDTIVVDNSANCIIWRHKHNFIPSTYRTLDPSKSPDICTASGQGSPMAIGDLNIGWYDDFGT